MKSADPFTEIRRIYNTEGTDALSPLDVHWLITEIVRLRDVVAFQDMVLEGWGDE